VIVRLATVEDAEAIRDIYNVEVEASTVTFDLIARTEAEQRVWMHDHSGAYPCIVAIATNEEFFETGAVLGYASLSPFRDRPAYATTVENSVYVDRSARGLGLGKVLLLAILEAAKNQGFHSVIARITGHNGLSVTLHQQVGFEVVGLEREVGRKHGVWLDVIELQLLLD
jgi:L-amino acid N-acyltransferase YncA